jgi:hypothetical protein
MKEEPIMNSIGFDLDKASNQAALTQSVELEAILINIGKGIKVIERANTCIAPIAAPHQRPTRNILPHKHAC